MVMSDIASQDGNLVLLSKVRKKNTNEKSSTKIHRTSDKKVL